MACLMSALDITWGITCWPPFQMATVWLDCGSTEIRTDVVALEGRMMSKIWQHSKAPVNSLRTAADKVDLPNTDLTVLER